MKRQGNKNINDFTYTKEDEERDLKRNKVSVALQYNPGEQAPKIIASEESISFQVSTGIGSPNFFQHSQPISPNLILKSNSNLSNTGYTALMTSLPIPSPGNNVNLNFFINISITYIN